MKIMKYVGIALTVSMIGCAAASAHTVPAPQVFSSSHPSDMSAVQPALPGTSKTEKANAAPATQQPAKPLAFANFGQWDEASSEN